MEIRFFVFGRSKQLIQLIYPAPKRERERGGRESERERQGKRKGERGERREREIRDFRSVLCTAHLVKFVGQHMAP